MEYVNWQDVAINSLFAVVVVESVFQLQPCNGVTLGVDLRLFLNIGVRQ